MMAKIDRLLATIQLYSYLLPTCKVGNGIQTFRSKYTMYK